MLGPVLLALACLDVPQTSDTAYAVMIGGSSWSCAEASDLAAARAARVDGGDVIWFRIGKASYALSDDADLDDMASLLSPLAQLESRQAGLEEKIAEYDAELSKLQAESARLDEDRARYAPGSEKNRTVSAERTAVEERRQVLADRRAEMAPDQERLRAELSRAFADARGRLGLLIDRALRHGTARSIGD
jgi:multidrug resistance efflux pump